MENERNTLKDDRNVYSTKCESLNKDNESYTNTIRELTDKIRQSETVIAEYETQTTSSQIKFTETSQTVKDLQVCKIWYVLSGHGFIYNWMGIHVCL